jgi:hypothetical protein
VVHSYRTTTKLINRVRYQPIDGTPYRTLQTNTESEGARLINYLESKTTHILRRHRFAEDGTYKGRPDVFGSCEPDLLPKQQVKMAAEQISGDYSVSELLDNPVGFENPTKSVNMAVDDVGVKRQSETRQKVTADSNKPHQRKSVYSTVVRIDHDQKRYSLVGAGIKITLRYLMAFLLSNQLSGKRFQFFTDGHTILNKTICSCFKWYPNFGIILLKCFSKFSSMPVNRFITLF